MSYILKEEENVDFDFDSINIRLIEALVSLDSWLWLDQSKQGS